MLIEFHFERLTINTNMCMKKLRIQLSFTPNIYHWLEEMLILNLKKSCRFIETYNTIV